MKLRRDYEKGEYVTIQSSDEIKEFIERMTTRFVKLLLTKNFLREFKRLPEDLRNRILRAIDEIVANPFLGVKLRDELEGRWRWRVGKHRIMYTID